MIGLMANEWSRSSFSVDAVGQGHTPQNVINGLTSFLTQAGWSVPAWSTNSLDRYFVRTDHATSDVWWFNGDGPTQKCGIRINYNAGSSRFEIRCFLENTGATGVQRWTLDAQAAYITWDGTAPNNWLVIGGEDGLFWETGRDGNPVNLGHGFVATHRLIPEFYCPRPGTAKWFTQGFVCDLVGSIKFSTNRTNTQFITNDGSNRIFTSYLIARMVRGSSAVVAWSPVDDFSTALSSRQLVFAGTSYANSSDGRNTIATLGLAWTPTNGRVVVSPLMLQMHELAPGWFTHTGTVTSGQSVRAPDGGYVYLADIRFARHVSRFAAIDYTQIGFANVSDAITGVVYRVSRFADGGRATNIAVEWPATIITSSVV